jgi:hypothetical protein
VQHPQLPSTCCLQDRITSALSVATRVPSRRRSGLGRDKLLGQREALCALTTCCYMAHTRKSGSTSAALWLVGCCLAGLGFLRPGVTSVNSTEVERLRNWGKLLLDVRWGCLGTRDWGRTGVLLRRRTCRSLTSATAEQHTVNAYMLTHVCSRSPPGCPSTLAPLPACCFYRLALYPSAAVPAGNVGSLPLLTTRLSQPPMSMSKPILWTRRH